MMYSDQVTNMINKLRRATGDIDTEDQSFIDDTFGEYLSDAIDILESGQFQKNISMVDGEIVDNDTLLEKALSLSEENIYVLQAQIVMKTGIKDRADRENFSLSKGKLRVDTTGQSADHDKTLLILTNRLNKLLYYFMTSSALTDYGVRVE